MRRVISSTFTVQTSYKGDGGVAASVTPGLVSVPCGSDGKAKGTLSWGLSFSLTVGGVACSGVKAVASSLPTGVSANTSGGSVVGIVVTPSATASGISGGAAFTVSGTLDGRSFSARCTLGMAGATQGSSGDSGHTGRFFYYAGVYDGVPSHYSIEQTQAPYVKYGSEFWMLDNKGTEPESLPWSPDSAPSDAARNPWTKMKSDHKYYIAEAYFGSSAHLGSFIINGDWLISQNGIQYVPNGQGGWTTQESSAYTYFDSNHPHDNNGNTNFVPNVAIDGKTGRIYMRMAYVEGEVVIKNAAGAGVVRINAGSSSTTTSEKGVTILDASGLYSRDSDKGDGFRLNATNGLQRYDPRTSTWFPFFAKRRVRVLVGQNPVLAASDDMVVLTGNIKSVKLPSSPENGDVITIRVLNESSAHLLLGNSAHKLYTDKLFNYDAINSDLAFDITQNHRYELVFWNNIWYLNFFGLGS